MIVANNLAGNLASSIWPLVLVDSLGSLAIGFTFVLIFIAALYIYLRGNISSSPILYPRLWKFAMAFVLWCGVARFGEFAEIWSGNLWVYYLVIAAKIFTSLCSALFVAEFLRVKDEFVMLAVTIKGALDLNETDKRNSL